MRYLIINLIHVTIQIYSFKSFLPNYSIRNTPQEIDNPEDIGSTIILVITIEKFDSVFDVLPQGYQVPAQHKNFLHFYS